MRGLRERLYQLSEPFVRDLSRFGRAFGPVATPHEEAV
jgi:hypothetical protein